jgi:predicted transcriptional regulator
MAQEPTKADIQKKLEAANRQLDEIRQENEQLATENSVLLQQLKDANEANQDLMKQVKDLKENPVVVANIARNPEPKAVKKAGPKGIFEIRQF